MKTQPEKQGQNNAGSPQLSLSHFSLTFRLNSAAGDARLSLVPARPFPEVISKHTTYHILELRVADATPATSGIYGTWRSVLANPHMIRHPVAVLGATPY